MNKYNPDFTTIPTEIADKITAKVKELNCNPIMMCRLNNHPDESNKLFMVIAKYITPSEYFSGQYAVWTASMLNGRVSLNYGHYHVSFKTALELVNDRVRDLNREETK